MALGRKPIEIVNEGKHQLLTKAGHWGRIFLRDVAYVQNGFAFSSSKFVKSDGFPLIRIRDIGNTTTVDRYSGEYSNDFIVKKGDILIGMDGDFKVAVWRGEDALLNQRVCRIIPNSKKIIPSFLFICLQPYLNAINEETSSVTVKHLSSRTIEEIPLPYPSITEQAAIVSKIEELFSELENGKQQLLLAQQQLKVYRQSLLKAAFEGKLTTVGIGRDLSQKDGELPEGWKMFKLDEIINKISDGPFGSNLKSIDYVLDGVRVIRLENIGEMEFRNEYKSYITPVKYETIKNHTVRKGDIIFSSFISETIRSVILPDFIDKAVNKADCFMIQVNEKMVLRQYLSFYFSTRSMRNQLVNQIHGATRPRINTRQLKNSDIPVPTLKEQKLIVDELESKLTVCNKIDEILNQSLQQAENLRQSILKKAFEGQLIQNS